MLPIDVFGEEIPLNRDWLIENVHRAITLREDDLLDD